MNLTMLRRKTEIQKRKSAFLYKKLMLLNQRTKLKKELRAANLRPSDQMIAEKLSEMKNAIP